MSVHLARELARIYGNVDYGVRDQETNTRNTRSFIQAHKKSTRRGRKQLTDPNDIYLSNQNTGAKAVRECSFAILPGWPKAEAGKLLSETLKRGEGVLLPDRITEAVQAFAGRGITRAQLERHVGRGQAQWQEEDVASQHRVWASITRDGVAAAEFFSEEPVALPGAEQ